MRLRRMFLVLAAIMFMQAKEVLFCQNTADNLTVHAEVMMSSEMLGEIPLDITFVNSMAITSAQYVLLASPLQFYVLGWGGIVPVGTKYQKGIYSFDYSSEGALMVVHGQELSFIDTLGKIVHYYSLPNEGMGIASGKNAMYLFDQKPGLETYNLYLLAQGDYIKIFTYSAPINAILEIDETIYFASANKLYSLNLLSRELKEMAYLPQGSGNILSIAVNTKGNIMYFSAPNGIYALQDGKTTCISDQFGGLLKYFKDGLLVFAPERKFLIRLVENEKLDNTETGARGDSDSDVITNELIVEMVMIKYADADIIELIRQSKVSFKLDDESINYLRKQNVSTEVVEAMKNAMKKQK